jgi:catechol 2,3-dioxygenase-like lactoylglutathione lyase family enzyme
LTAADGFGSVATKPRAVRKEPSRRIFHPEKEIMMAKIKHIALSTQDPEKTAAFYKETLGLQEVGKVNSPLAEGYYLTDGSINVAILKFKNDQAADKPEGVNFVGLHHFGFKVDSLDETEARLEAANADKRPQVGMGMPQGTSHRNVEVKYRGPDGVIFDISSTGWVGTSDD